jgi:hypothetical protein
MASCDWTSDGLAPSIARALRHAARHPAVRNCEIVSMGDDQVVAHFDMVTDLPARWKEAGESPFGVRALEKLTVTFASTYPASVPSVELRKDFDRRHPHINPGPTDGPVVPCLVNGSVRELLQARGMFGLMEQCADWLDRAAMLALNDPAHGWEPVRRDRIDDLVSIDPSELRALAQTSAGARYARTRFVLTNGVYRTRVFSEEFELRFDNIRSFGSTDFEHGVCGDGLAVVAWHRSSGRSVRTFDEYRPETVSNLDELLERSNEYGCRADLISKLNWIAHRLRKHPGQSVIPVTVLLLVRRPYDVIGTGSPIEVCPYLIPVTEYSDLENPETHVRLAAVRDHVDVSVLRRASGTDPDAPTPSWTLIGCGSVGSKVAMHAARGGVGPSLLIDRETLEPHNYARHALLPEFDGEALFFPGKASALAKAIKGLAQKADAIAEDVVALAYGDGGRDRLTPVGETMIVDATASPVVREALVAAGSKEGVMGIEICLMGGGEVAYASCEGPGANPNRSDLALEAYRIFAQDDDISRTVFGAHAQEVTIGQGCSSATFAMPDHKLSAMSAGLAGCLSDWMWRGTTELGEVRVGISGSPEPSQRWERHQVPAFMVIAGERPDVPAVRMHPRVHQKIEKDIAAWPGVETGGVLIGRFSEMNGVFQIVDTITAPDDSRRSSAEFVLGTQGLTASIERLTRRSGGALQAIGTWHNHLVPVGPSAIDRRSAAWLAERQCTPVLMLISTPEGYRHFVTEQADPMTKAE